MNVGLLFMTIILCPVIAYLSYIWGYLGGFTKGLKEERPEPILEQIEAFKKPFEKHKFAIIPSRREKIEIEKEEAENFVPSGPERFLK